MLCSYAKESKELISQTAVTKVCIAGGRGGGCTKTLATSLSFKMVLSMFHVYINVVDMCKIYRYLWYDNTYKLCTDDIYY